MMISNVHLNSPVEIRFTINYGGHERIRFVMIAPGDGPLEIANAIAANVNHFVRMADSDSPLLKPFDAEAHVAGILADAPRYGCD